MLKAIFVFAILISSALFSFGQLKVFPAGNVVVGSTTPSSWVLTADGYAGILTRYGGTYVRLNSHPVNGCLGSSTGRFVFWTPTSGPNKVWALDYGTLSDSSRKENIIPVSNGLEVVMDLYPVRYSLKVDSLNPYSKTGYGFTAQDVEQIVPEIVDTTLGMKGIRMDEITPFLVDAIQTQQAQIDSLRNRIIELEKCDCKIKNKNKSIMADSVTDHHTQDLTAIELKQNNPNPFKESTIINYSVPENTTNAQIIVYDLSGKELETFIISNFGQGQIVLEGNTFKPGMYIYALIVDGKYIESKKMLLLRQ